jgi:BASS family bile acid:Na+ symporter
MNDGLFYTLVQHPGFTLFARIVVFLALFGLGLRLSREVLTEIRTYPGALAKALVAAVVLVPLGGLTLGYLYKQWGLPAEVGLGLILLVACPGAPLLTQRTGKAGGDFEFSAALQILCGVMAILVTPAILWSYAQFFPNLRSNVEFWHIAEQVAIIQFLPLSLGLATRLLWFEAVDAVTPVFLSVVNKLRLAYLVVVVIPSLPVVVQAGVLPMVAVVLFAIMALLLGHLMGGPDLTYQAAIAVGCVARNLGLALFIAILNRDYLNVLPTLVGYALLGSLVTIPYSKWMKHRIHQHSVDALGEVPPMQI